MTLNGKNSTGGLPEWLLRNTEYNSSPKGRTKFLRKTIGDFSAVLKNEFLSEKYASREGLLQSVDPRVKLIVLIIFAALGSCVSNIAALVILALVALIYAAQSKLNIRDFLRRVWCYLPPLLFIVSLPAATSVVNAGSPLIYIVKSAPFAPQGIFFTSGGLIAALRVALRCGVSLGFGYLVFITTRVSDIEKALYALKVPGVIVSVFGMAYRYIFVLTGIAQDMVEARFSRTVGKVGGSSGRRFSSHSAAALFIKSQKMSAEVYDAMSCRCYAGKSVSLSSLKAGPQDFIFAFANAIIILILIVF